MEIQQEIKSLQFQRISLESSSVNAFVSEHDGKKGFVMSGHATAGIGGMDTPGDRIGQATHSRDIGTERAVANPTTPYRFCDCAFIEFDKNGSGQYIKNWNPTQDDHMNSHRSDW